MSADRHQLVERLCSEALDLAPSARAAFLAEACPDDGVRTEVLALLAHERDVDLFLQPLPNLPAAMMRPALLPQQRIGPYEVIALMGSGGMGHVYRARDTRLQRDVALKVLSPLAGVAKGHSRLLKEARMLAALNHPNVAAIYGVEEVDGAPALALELVEGTTLDTRLERGPLAVAEAVAIARQIAAALDAAHGQGLTHRDLKPSNVMVRPDATVKLLDFGIAKALALSGESAQDDGATETQSGVVLGTTAYMSPEQARGDSVDARTDIWAFGCVLFEMLSGRAVFQRTTAQDTLAAVLTADPDWSALPPEAPPALVRLLRRCLQRDPAQRLRHIADAGFALDELPAEAEAVPLATVRRSHQPWRWLALGITGIAMVLIAWAVIPRTRPPAAAPSTVRFELALPATQSATERGVAISPDGMSLAFVAAGATGDDALWVRRLDQLVPVQLSNTQGAYSPFWSPDGRSIGFFADGKLKRISAAGGDAFVICDVEAPADLPAGTWGRNDTIVFAQTFGPLQKVAASGGSVTAATTLRRDREEFGHYNPFFLPDGEHFAFEIGAVPERLGIHVGSLTSLETAPLMTRSVWPFAITGDGALIFKEGRALRAQRIDLERLQLEGDAVVVADGVTGAVSAAGNGTVIYRNESSVRTQLTWVDRTGRTLGTVGQPGYYATATLSPDDRKVAIAHSGDIWVLDLVRGIESRVTSDPSNEILPHWSPDGQEILFNRGIVGPLVKRRASGAGGDEVVLETGGIPWGWSADDHVVFGASGPDTFLDLYTLAMHGDRTPKLYLRTPFQDTQGRLSPDGTLMAYASALSGRSEIYVQPFRASQERWQVSANGGAEPQWRADGRELYYVALDGQLTAVKIAPRSSAPVGASRALFRTLVPLPGRTIYSPASDGQRFLINALLDSRRTVVVALDWTKNLRAQTPRP